MLPILTAAAGAVAGAFFARQRGGKGFDIAQYAAVWAVMGGIVGFLAVLVLTRV